MDHSHHEDDFEGYAPPRRMDLGARSPAERPEWLTAAGERDLRDLPPGRADSAREAGALHTGARPATPAKLSPPSEARASAAGDSWESAVGRAAHDDELLTEESGTASRGPEMRTHASSGAVLQSIVGALSKSPPLVFVALAVIAVVALMMFHPKEEQTVSIGAIHRHPERFDGRPVKVKGRVGEVYQVGGGYAFHLMQGREDLVVFTRSRVPVRREEVTIEGSISNGVLDGKTRQALFETAH